MSLARALGRQVIQHMAPSGVLSGVIIRAVKKAGYSYRRKDMLADIREATGRFRYQTNIESLAAGQRVPQSWMSEGALRRGYRYRVHGLQTVYDRSIGEWKIGYKSFYTDEWRNMGEWEESFVEASRKAYEWRAEEEVTGFQVQSVEHNEGFAY